MKQHIEKEQLGELSDAQKQVLKNWWKPSVGDWIFTTAWADSETKHDVVICMSSPTGMIWSELLKEAMPLLSIGQMIEFLSDTGNNFWISYDRNPMLWSYTKGKTPHPEDQNTVPELCDALWEAVKEELEKE